MRLTFFHTLLSSRYFHFHLLFLTFLSTLHPTLVSSDILPHKDYDTLHYFVIELKSKHVLSRSVLTALTNEVLLDFLIEWNFFTQSSSLNLSRFKSLKDMSLGLQDSETKKRKRKSKDNEEEMTVDNRKSDDWILSSLESYSLKVLGQVGSLHGYFLLSIPKSLVLNGPLFNSFPNQFSRLSHVSSQTSPIHSSFVTLPSSLTLVSALLLDFFKSHPLVSWSEHILPKRKLFKRIPMAPSPPLSSYFLSLSESNFNSTSEFPSSYRPSLDPPFESLSSQNLTHHTLSSSQNQNQVQNQKQILIQNQNQEFPTREDVIKEFNLHDPQFLKQWHLVNGAPNYEGNDIRVLPVWRNNIHGQGVTVCIIDDGIDMTSEDIKDNFVSFYSLFSLTKNEELHGSNSHGVNLLIFYLDTSYKFLSYF